jgi:glycosyltransferase involved in cell wall biosynthesis
VTELIERCSAVCFPGREDFGIVPVEANAAGKPVVAFAAGGALETLKDGFSGVFFERQDVDSVLEAFKRVDALDSAPEELAESASRFSPDAFRRNLEAAIARIAARRRGQSPRTSERYSAATRSA